MCFIHCIIVLNKKKCWFISIFDFKDNFGIVSGCQLMSNVKICIMKPKLFRTTALKNKKGNINITIKYDNNKRVLNPDTKPKVWLNVLILKYTAKY